MRKSIISTLVTLSLAAAAVPLAVAQSAAPSAAPQRPAHAQSAFKPSERVEARLAYVKTALKITDAQAPQWNAYANVVRKHAQQADQRMQERRTRMAQGAERKRPTAIERLERRQQFLTVAATRAGERLAVQKPLYAALSAEQQRVADEVFAPRGHRGQRGGRHHGGGRHGRA